VSGWIFLAIGAIVTAMDLAVGLHLMGREADLTAPHGDDRAADAAQGARAGRLIMLLSPVFFLIFAALAFGLIPVEAIEPISLGVGQ
jgi:hypothetical protein